MDWAEEKYDVSMVYMCKCEHFQTNQMPLLSPKLKCINKKKTVDITILLFLFVWLQKLLIAQVKMVVKVLFLYIPLPMFWALFDQQVTIRSLLNFGCLSL